jgi:hypothetical protein
MLNKTSNFVAIFLMALLITAGLSCAQEGDLKEQNHSDMKDHNMNHETMMDSSKMKMDHNHMDHDKMKDSEHKKMMQEEVSIAHEGVIDLAAIDEDGDGKVYQDQMCWNVISDKAGDCPQCGMKLKEVSLEEAKANLIENDYEVKK